MISMKVEDRLEGASNFIPWKSRVLLLLEENDLLQCVNEKVPEPKAGEDKLRWRKNDVSSCRSSHKRKHEASTTDVEEDHHHNK